MVKWSFKLYNTGTLSSVSVKRRLPTGAKMQTEGKMQTADYRLLKDGAYQIQRFLRQVRTTRKK